LLLLVVWGGGGSRQISGGWVMEEGGGSAWAASPFFGARVGRNNQKDGNMLPLLLLFPKIASPYKKTIIQPAGSFI
jgi:hypothetical protein